MSSASLFPNQQKSKFVTITADRFRNMGVRLVKKKLPPPPFTLAQLRDHIYRLLGERYDGAIRCKYCGRICDLSEVELDHAVPIARGGSLALSNIEAPCAQCNSAKGESTSEEFAEFMKLRERIPFAFDDLYNRLAKYGKLVAAKRKSDMLLRNQGQFPAKKPKPGKPPIISAIDEVF
jgi:hypothetical protein